MRKFTKKTAVVVLPIAVLGVAGVAYAATLGVSSDILGGGNDTVDSDCKIQASYVTVPAAGQTPDVTWHAAVADVTGTQANEAKPAGYYLDTVTLTSTGTECAGATYRLTVAGTGDAQIAEATGTLVGTGTEKVDPTTDVLADNVTDLFAVVTKTKTN